MAKRLQLRRGTTAEHAVFTGAIGEVTVDTTKDTAVVHDGSRIGGFPLARESALSAHTSATGNVHGITFAQVNSKPTTLSGYGITDAYTKTEVNNSLALKVDDSEIASVNLLRADKYLAAQNIANMSYADGNLTKIQYNNATNVDYEVLTYDGNGKLSNVAHYTTSMLRGNTALSYSGGKIVSAIYTGV